MSLLGNTRTLDALTPPIETEDELFSIPGMRDVYRERYESSDGG